MFKGFENQKSDSRVSRGNFLPQAYHFGKNYVQLVITLGSASHFEAEIKAELVTLFNEWPNLPLV
jgi:hypothetical protein